MKICIVLGTRPEIIKLFPLIFELKKNKINFFIVHTGQHKIFSMQGQFIRYFNLKVQWYALWATKIIRYYPSQRSKFVNELEEVIWRQRRKETSERRDRPAHLSNQTQTQCTCQDQETHDIAYRWNWFFFQFRSNELVQTIIARYFIW